MSRPASYACGRILFCSYRLLAGCASSRYLRRPRRLLTGGQTSFESLPGPGLAGRIAVRPMGESLWGPWHHAKDAIVPYMTYRRPLQRFGLPEVNVRECTVKTRGDATDQGMQRRPKRPVSFVMPAMPETPPGRSGDLTL